LSEKYYSLYPESKQPNEFSEQTFQNWSINLSVVNNTKKCLNCECSNLLHGLTTFKIIFGFVRITDHLI
jgi:hypothetical protein